MGLFSNDVFVSANIDVHEHRAPTDESVKLLNEMEEKARENIIASISVTDNTINGVALAYVDEVFTAGRPYIRIYLKFSVNGREYSFEETVNAFEHIPDQKEMVLYLQDRLKAKVVDGIFRHMQAQIIEQLTGKQIEKYL